MTKAQKSKAPAAAKKAPSAKLVAPSAKLVAPSTKPEAPVVAPTIEAKGQGIGAFCREQIKAGKTNPEILVLVQATFPNASTSTGSIAWYRSAMKKAGQL